MLTTATGKPRVSGFHCRQLQKDAYKALKAFMALTGATTEEALGAYTLWWATAPRPRSDSPPPSTF
jgi:hypothetical protein